MNTPSTHRRAGRWGRWRGRLGEAGRKPRLGWRLLAPVTFVVAGVLLVTSAVSSQGTDLRPERYDDLADLATTQAERLEGLQDRAAELQAANDDLASGLDPGNLDLLQDRIDSLEGPAGLEPVRGPGVTVTLTDAPKEVLASAGDNVEQAIVHQQDIQAVVNALWAGGAEAMTIQGQRVVSTTGIKCVGNSVVLHGLPYSPPYVISATGDTDAMLDAIDDSAYIDAYLSAVEQFGLGWEVEEETDLRMPAFDGSTELTYAQPLD